MDRSGTLPKGVLASLVSLLRGPLCFGPDAALGGEVGRCSNWASAPGTVNDATNQIVAVSKHAGFKYRGFMSGFLRGSLGHDDDDSKLLFFLDLELADDVQ